MEITIQIPDELATLVTGHDAFARELLEAFTAHAYRNDRISSYQVGQLLGLDRWQTEEFLASRDAIRPYDIPDLNVDRATLESLG